MSGLNLKLPTTLTFTDSKRSAPPERPKAAKLKPFRKHRSPLFASFKQNLIDAQSPPPVNAHLPLIKPTQPGFAYAKRGHFMSPATSVDGPSLRPTSHVERQPPQWSLLEDEVVVLTPRIEAHYVEKLAAGKLMLKVSESNVKPVVTPAPAQPPSVGTSSTKQQAKSDATTPSSVRPAVGRAAVVDGIVTGGGRVAVAERRNMARYSPSEVKNVLQVPFRNLSVIAPSLNGSKSTRSGTGSSSSSKASSEDEDFQAFSQKVGKPVRSAESSGFSFKMMK
ncbi:hypothetical protein BV898_09812 [Hypsibius exemplaris]|uniref:Uncharacterized protein n=1 Tax=Hypsibius exemplaris TaxID=2072580 RepID=A0A1W0WLI4_HYPEX|nr:hypothetical protein BV898_09812 [Hypsibius exemplaris]